MGLSQDEFSAEYNSIVHLAMTRSEKARREGLLALEETINNEKYKERDIMEYGLRMVVDGTDAEYVDKVLSNLVNFETDSDRKLLKTIQREAVMGIQVGLNPRLLLIVLNSYAPFGVEEAMKKYFGE